MYDISQLNDMLVPELLDIAEQLKLSNAKKLDKQELVYKILDAQATKASETKEVKKTRTRKPITVKASTANITEEAEVMQEAPQHPDQDKAAVAKHRGRKPKPAEPEAMDDAQLNLGHQILQATEDPEDAKRKRSSNRRSG